MILPHDEAGTGPAVVFLHAGVADRGMWSEHLRFVAAAGHRAVALDLPGFGEALPAPGEQAPWSDVVETMDALSIERAVLVGSSFGGAVALRVAVAEPERVRALALISAPAPDLEPSPELAAAWEAEEAALERGDVHGAVEAVLAAWTLPDAPSGLRERLAAMQRRALEQQAAALEATEAPDPLEQRPEALAAIDVPALVAAGERDMEYFRRSAEIMSATLPRARHTLIRDAGHLAPLETPERFRELLLEFLA